ncbi:EF-hand calcium-binding domain-containing 7 [Pelobates cultripes]|uniref:EF-hand calcium-binding domain-containing protein 7 n=1 Tax=Pelobates cultripes TaxID=61616 RepID=A0AAD1WFE4_PELCU|nr:EF-hand calcium-binding domain-containing 7 [Pelobates cultripes]CAH2310914.1 EF-hand calcium-binding domain-containing 7 [Pelobates cultripes]CAH2310915.1 EF-hand calcium-binding domain-containing 7 [Pelobates cultripes]CAH2310916.1 EF-hand calcium-binding domain-containing 7 [Pelobates cultripes]
MASPYGSNMSLSNQKHPTNERQENRKSQPTEEEAFYSTCRAAYLTVFKSSLDNITSREQLCLVLQLAGRNPTNKILTKYWTARTKELHFDDFCTIMKREKPAAKTELLKAFKKIDPDNKGYIFHDDLSRILTGNGEKMSQEEVRAVLRLADINSNGRLEYNKFCNKFFEICDQCTKTAADRMDSDNKAKRQQFGSQIQKSPERSASPSAKQSPRNSRLSEGDTTPRKAESKSSRPSSARSYKASVSTMFTMAAVNGKNSKLAEPNNLQGWNFTNSKGCFFLEENGDVISHRYKMQIPQKTTVFLKIKPYNLSKVEGKPSSWMSVDTALFILKESDGRADPQLVSFTESRYKETFTLKGELGPGVYHMIPFTTGCRLRKKRKQTTKDAQLVYRDRNEDLILTPEFKSVLSDMFDIIDLDGNGYLSLEEYNFFELRTSGEKCDEDAWEVCKENFETSKNELTKQGFLELNLMEANDREGDPSDLWVTLQSMGYNKTLELTEACPFLIEAYAEKCKPKLQAVSLESSTKQLQKVVCRSVILKGDAKSAEGYEDVAFYTYMNDTRISSVIENKSNSKVVVQVNNEQSKNCISSRGLDVFAVEVPPKATMVSQHVMPMNERQECTYHCVQSIVS